VKRNPLHLEKIDCWIGNRGTWSDHKVGRWHFTNWTT
jgi:hypothetical protein